jgi:hypothetical protein
MSNHNGVIAGEKLRPAVPQKPASLVIRVIEPEEFAPRRHKKHFPPKEGEELQKLQARLERVRRAGGLTD